MTQQRRDERWRSSKELKRGLLGTPDSSMESSNSVVVGVTVGVIVVLATAFFLFGKMGGAGSSAASDGRQRCVALRGYMIM
jgi:hypothetical protein